MNCEEQPGAMIGNLDNDVMDIKHSYYLVHDPCDPTNNGLGTPLTDESMRQQASFAGWDFVGETDNGIDDIWAMPGDGYPYLNHLK